jgi:long-chain acyl-CoA synthetase
MGLTERSRAGCPAARAPFGLNGALLAPLLAGATVVLQERFSPEETLRAIARHRVTVFPGVATMFSRILEAPSPRGLLSLRPPFLRGALPVAAGQRAARTGCGVARYG